MSKRVRYTSNNTSLIVGKIHRRVFKTVVALPITATYVVAITATGDFQFGSDSLPRRPGYIWAQEVVKVNFQWQQNDPDSQLKPTLGYAAITNSNDATFLASLATTTGPTYAYRRDEVLAVSCYNEFIQQATGTAVGNSGQMTQRMFFDERTIDLTDLMGQGVLVFGNNLYLLMQNYTNAAISHIFATAEVWFKYVEVPLEYYLSTQQDAMASGV